MTQYLPLLKRLILMGVKYVLLRIKKKKIVGAISDGDIRRFLITRKSFDEVIKAKDICNSKFIFSHTKFLSESLLNKIKNKIDLIPIIRNSELKRFFTYKILKKKYYNKSSFNTSGW